VLFAFQLHRNIPFYRVIDDPDWHCRQDSIGAGLAQRNIEFTVSLAQKVNFFMCHDLFLSCGMNQRLQLYQMAVRKGKQYMATARLLKVPEAAEMLALSQKTVWQWIGERRIGVVRLGRAVRIPQAEIDRLMEEGTTPARRG
jgi:excisionase family DNA binding protein